MTPKDTLLAELARSRTAVARDFSTIRSELDVAAKLRQSVKSRPFAWLGSAAAIGYMIAGPKRRTRVVTKTVSDHQRKPTKPEVRESRSLVGTLLVLFKIVSPLVRPALAAYAARRFGDFAEKLGK